MELGLSQGKFMGKCHTCGKQGHKAAKCWSGGKTPHSNRRPQYQQATPQQ